MNKRYKQIEKAIMKLQTQEHDMMGFIESDDGSVFKQIIFFDKSKTEEMKTLYGDKIEIL